MVTQSRTANGRFVAGSQSGDNNPSIGNESDKAVDRGTVDGPEIVDPAKIGAETNNGNSDNPPEPKRGRGRPKGNGPKTTANRKEEKSGGFHLASLNALLFSVHTLGATILSMPEIALKEDESKELATAIGNVSRHYDIKASEKMIDWGNLMIALAMIYGMRFYSYSERRKQEKIQKMQVSNNAIFVTPQ